MGGLKDYAGYSKVIGGGFEMRVVLNKKMTSLYAWKDCHLAFSVTNWENFSDLLNTPKYVYIYTYTHINMVF